MEAKGNWWICTKSDKIVPYVIFPSIFASNWHRLVIVFQPTEVQMGIDQHSDVPVLILHRNGQRRLIVLQNINKTHFTKLHFGFLSETYAIRQRCVDVGPFQQQFDNVFLAVFRGTHQRGGPVNVPKFEAEYRANVQKSHLNVHIGATAQQQIRRLQAAVRCRQHQSCLGVLKQKCAFTEINDFTQKSLTLTAFAFTLPIWKRRWTIAHFSEIWWIYLSTSLPVSTC